MKITKDQIKKSIDLLDILSQEINDKHIMKRTVKNHIEMLKKIIKGL